MPTCHVHVVESVVAHDVPPRISEAGVREIVEALGGPDGDLPVEDALRATFAALPFQQLAERLLELLLIQPPIPAYCESLVRQMEDAHHPPWLDHDVREDRFSLWFAHRLLATGLPDRFHAPAVRRLTLEVTPSDPAVRVPGPRTGAHEKTSFVARVLRPFAPAGVGADDDSWAFDLVWAVEVGERRASADGASTTRLVVYATPGWLDAVEPGRAWDASA